jgi:hypothetical protein
MQRSEAFVGAEVTLTREVGGEQIGYGGFRRWNSGRVGYITRIGTQSVIVRSQDVSIWVELHDLDLTGRSVSGSGPARKLGTKPEDTEEQAFIGIDDPGVQWIWDDLAEYAQRQSWCSQYDQLAAAVNIPGRPRNFTVRAMVNGNIITMQPRARSANEAIQFLRDSLPGVDITDVSAA